MSGTIEADQAGDLQHFGTVHYLSESPANVLCMADVEDTFNVSRVPSSSYTVYVSSNARFVFNRIQKLYV
jgi:hypothetical protein